jgi:mono/diheme cytochrome c family protein
MMMTAIRPAFRLLVVVAVAALGLYASGCDYTLSSHPPVARMHISVTPSRWTMETGSSLELSAKVTGYKSDSTVTWALAPSTVGTLEAFGNGAIYTSPDSILGASDTVRIMVTSNENPSKLAICTIAIIPASINPPVSPTISISPLAPVIQPGASQQFTATVMNATDTSVIWSLEGQGTLTQNGLYVAPANVSSRIKATVKVTLVQDTSVWTAAEVTVEPPAMPCFWNDTKAILGSFCTAVGPGRGCHNATQRVEGDDLTKTHDILAMANSFEHGQSKLLASLEGGGENAMPPAGYPQLTADQIATIRAWVAGGKDTSPCTNGGNTGCDTTGVRYSTFVRATFQNACLGCHTGINSTGRYDLSNYAGVAFVAQSGQLVGSISHTAPYRAMPDGGAKLDDCTIAKIRAWVNAGAPNN